MRWLGLLVLLLLSMPLLRAEPAPAQAKSEKGTYLGVLFSPIPDALYDQVPNLPRNQAPWSRTSCRTHRLLAPNCCGTTFSSNTATPRSATVNTWPSSSRRTSPIARSSCCCSVAAGK